MLERAAERFADRGLGLLDARGRPAERRSWREVLAAARASAGRLARHGVRPGAPVPICLPTSWEFLDAWLGALVHGAWPVAVAAPGGLGGAEHHLERLEAVCDALDVETLVCSDALRAAAAEAGRERARAVAVTPEELDALAPLEAGARVEADPEDVAFLQLTSGSTGAPRAVVIPHRAAVHNAFAIEHALATMAGAPPRAWPATGVSWLPLHHDMGLVGGLLFCAFAGIDLWLMRPRTFLGRPQTWLREIARHPLTMSAAPSFAYHTCVERVPPSELAGVDLSGLRAALVGAEMIRPETMSAFADAYACLGFDARAFRPCYGLAEATLAVTFDVRGEGVRTRRVAASAAGAEAEVVSVGSPVADTAVEVRAPDGTPLPDGRVGAICVRGPGVFAGYWRDSAATDAALRDGWLWTGDLGLRADGDLWITGRSKDLLIVNGQNLSPHELEWVAERATGGGGTVRAGAFSVERRGAGEVPVLAVEVAETAALAALEREIRTRVGHAFAVPLADVVFLRRGALPKTTSGKVQRAELRRRYLAGALERLAGEP